MSQQHMDHPVPSEGTDVLCKHRRGDAEANPRPQPDANESRELVPRLKGLLGKWMAQFLPAPLEKAGLPGPCGPGPTDGTLG